MTGRAAGDGTTTPSTGHRAGLTQRVAQSARPPLRGTCPEDHYVGAPERTAAAEPQCRRS